MNDVVITRTAGNLVRPSKLIKCRVTVTMQSGNKHSYLAVFKSTSDALIEALDRFGLNRSVMVKALQ